MARQLQPSERSCWLYQRKALVSSGYYAHFLPGYVTIVLKQNASLSCALRPKKFHKNRGFRSRASIPYDVVTHRDVPSNICQSVRVSQ